MQGPELENELFKKMIPKDVELGIEIGVLYGDTSKFFLENWEKLNLIGIDPIIPDSMEKSLIGSIFKIKVNTLAHKTRFTFINDYSYRVASILPNGVDFIFIDGSHLYDDTKLDYELYYPKIKKGGLIFFHDSRMNRGGANFHPGPSQLVDEIIESDKGVKLIGETFSLTCFIKL
jgi:hypothetical protein